jgi:hypothetical protein
MWPAIIAADAAQVIRRLPMLTLDQPVDLYAVGFSAGYPGCRASAPTATSISHINSTLGIVLPPVFVAFAQKCPAYSGCYFTSIGEDYRNPRHILNENEEYHVRGPTWCVPSWLVVVTHIYDGDCEGLDSRRRNESGEYPVRYWDASEGLEFDNAGWPVFESFQDYLEQTIIMHAKLRDPKYVEKVISEA